MMKYTYTVKGQLFTFNTIKELHAAKRRLAEEFGMNVDEHSIKIVKVPTKATATISFSKTEDVYGENRSLVIDVIVKGEDRQYVLDKIREYMEVDTDIEFAYCDSDEFGEAIDNAAVPFQYGEMGAIRKEVLESFKKAKVALGI